MIHQTHPIYVDSDEPLIESKIVKLHVVSYHAWMHM